MQKFFDRKEACDIMQATIQQINSGGSNAIWIEGRSGVGKTRLLEYIFDQEPELNFFTFIADEVFYKCERGSAGSSFEYIAAIIFELQYRDPGFFERYIQSYFDSIQHISFLDACCLVLPQIKGLKVFSNLIDNKYKNITAMQGKISDRLVTSQLIDLFSDLILDFLLKVYKTDTIIFCIDDAQWLDQASIRVLEVLIKKSRQEPKSPSISVFLDIREKSGLSEDETRSYLNIFRTLSRLYPNLKTIYLNNFDLPTIQEVIRETNRYYLIKQIPLLYQVTEGNPMELEQTLRFSDERVQDILQKELRSNVPFPREDTFTLERISELYYQKPIYAVILSILAVLRRRISVQLLFRCMTDLYPILLNDVCPYPDFLSALSYLEEKECITRTASRNQIALAHDSIYQTVLDYLSQNSDYVVYGKGIADTLLHAECDTFLKEETQHLLALNLLYEVDSPQCLCYLRKLYSQSGERLEAGFFLTGAEAFCSTYLDHGQEFIHFAIHVILPRLVESANLSAAQQLCHTIYLDFDRCLSPADQIMYLINYIKAQVDLSMVGDSPESAVNLFEKLYQCPCENQNLKLQILLLGMSAYEHLLAHDKIRALYFEAEKLVQQEPKAISPAAMALFYRNKGLCFPHSELKSDYFRSLRYAVGIPNLAHRHLAFGTSMNNLGLSYFYRGEIKSAIRAFSFAKEDLARVGYNTARISNNIGTCYYMLHDWQAAYQHFSLAASAQTDGVFMSTCIQTNLALALYALGKKEAAKTILDSLISEYLQGNLRSHDTLVYCAAMINRGYIAFQDKDYFKAADCYQKSLIHTYRYQNNEQIQKRESMRDLAIQLGVNSDQRNESTMDLEDTSLDFYKKPYSLVPFAFYVI